MAYPSITGTYGFNPVNRLDGLPYAGVSRTFPIGTAALPYGSSIFHGDVVAINASGQLFKSGATTTTVGAGNFTVGVFVGCSYTNPSTLQPLFYNYYPANTAATDTMGIFIDDAFATYKVVLVNAAGGIISNDRTIVGANVAISQTNPGNILNGLSGQAITLPVAPQDFTTGVLPFRVIDVVPETGDGAGNYFEFIVKFNNHQYLSNTGV